ncbi:kynureninase [Macrococcoides canis]|uniref:kynureninase n=1 Tax=Macrococcoides canis TaxID=1855823 RepID=UPI00207D132E|nr:kynureninase [Macrococcus canis]MCO4095588.1 kynureninase [Macrococcus canis]UTH08302.1 kynureninase [Macrococcus canis]
MTTYEQIQRLDQNDVLKQYREEFYFNKDNIYFNGNSLGLMSKRAEASVMEIMAMWKQYGIDGWMSGTRPWFYITDEISKLFEPLIGAQAKNICITGSTTTNIHQMVATLYEPTPERYKIIADTLNFPSDIYALQSQLSLKGYPEALIEIESSDDQTLCTETIIEAMAEDVSLILLPSILYRSGQILDMERITKAAHDRGILVGFDLCHSIGSIPHELERYDVDFAVWCTYKHLNGGPGSVGGLYIHERHHHKSPGLAGWFGSDKEKQFDMAHTFTKAEDAKAYQIGTPHLLSLAPIIGAVQMVNEAGIHNIRVKSLKLTDLLIDLITVHLTSYGFSITTPIAHNERGGHVYIEHNDAARIVKAMKAQGIIPDFRAPRGIRLSPVALYNTYEEVYNVVMTIKTIMEDEVYKQYSNERDVVA